MTARIELDTNTVERAIRPVALGRKNHLFAGSDGGGARWGAVCSLAHRRRLDNAVGGGWAWLQRLTLPPR